MNEKDIAEKIRAKCGELSDLIEEAAMLGIEVRIDTSREQVIGISVDAVTVTPKIRKVQEL